MEAGKKEVRKPRQKRSRLTAERIADAALRLFCEKGYHATTTNEIAREAGVSIGSLYSYYEDKDAVLLEILGRYHERFLAVFDEIDGEVSRALRERDGRAWLRVLVDDLVGLHLSAKELNRELKGLYHLKGEVREMMDEQERRVREKTAAVLAETPCGIPGRDPAAVSLLVVDFVSAIVDRVVFDDGLGDAEKDELVEAGVDGLYRMLYG